MRDAVLPDTPVESGCKGVVPPRNEKDVGSIPASRCWAAVAARERKAAAQG